jgi:hypothetical protein
VAKQSGLGDRLFVDGFNISGDVMALGAIGGGPEELDMTAIDKSGKERIGGLRDGRIEATSYFNDATTTGAEGAFEVLSSLPTTDRIVTYCRGFSLGSPAANLVSKQANYDWERSEEGALTAETQFLPNAFGLDWGELYTAGLRTDTSATNGSSVDAGAASTFGLQMTVQLVAFTGTSVTVKLQSSSDDGAGDAFSDVSGATTGALTTVGASRVAVTGSLERYLRVVTTGTFTVANFVVSVTRNATAVSF